MNFTPIDRIGWSRNGAFEYVTKQAPTIYSITKIMDVTGMYDQLEKAGYRFFPAYLFFVTKALDRQREFRIAYRDGVLGYWDTLVPAYFLFHEDDCSNTLLWTEVDDNLSAFCRRYEQDRKEYGAIHGLVAKPTPPPENRYRISCIPWLSFDAFSLQHSGARTHFLPSFESGGLRYNRNRTSMPLAATVNHATVDGYHLAMFFKYLQDIMDDTAAWL